MRIIAAFFLLFIAAPTFAQQRPHPPAGHLNKYKKKDTVSIYNVDTLNAPIPMSRQLWHDKIDNEQKKADAADGREDNEISYHHDLILTDTLTNALLRDVDHMQVMIENIPAYGRDPVMDNQEKIRCLRALWEMLRFYNSDPKPDANFYLALVANMHGMIIASNEDNMMAFARGHLNIYTLDNGRVLFDNQPEVRAYVYTRLGQANPVFMIKRLEEFAKDTFAYPIIIAAARLQPDLVFKYALSSNIALKMAVYNTKDTLVQTIVKIAATSRAPLKAFPFLGDIFHNRMTIADADSIAERPAIYYDNLVRLRLGTDTIAHRSYTEELVYHSLKDYVRQMNELHEEKDDIRFKCIDSLTPRSLYFIMVYGQDEIYTSTFLGTFKRMVAHMKPMTGDQLLDTIHHDHFRTFIRMCAGYNTLSDFLGTMDSSTRTTLMGNFIGGLEFGRDDDLEDAVDVADAFGSIRDTTLSAFLQRKVKENYELSYNEELKKGMIVYSLLARLFQGNTISDNDTGAQVTSSRLHLPPINKVPYRDLVSDSGIVYQQVFFYGDKDGQDSYDSYMDLFKKDENWKITDSTYWTTISSVTGKPVVIYANLPLKEPDDDMAQDKLCRYLDSCNIHPTVMIHRGHSYHLPATLARLNQQVKIVILGSCGGYHNLGLVLDHAPDANIVSSKQTGVRAVNEPIIKALNDRLVAGQDVNWISMWRELEEYFQKRPDDQDKFSDYVPPYKNLGAIFIKAYRKVMAQ